MRPMRNNTKAMFGSCGPELPSGVRLLSWARENVQCPPWSSVVASDERFRFCASLSLQYRCYTHYFLHYKLVVFGVSLLCSTSAITTECVYNAVLQEYLSGTLQEFGEIFLDHLLVLIPVHLSFFFILLFLFSSLFSRHLVVDGNLQCLLCPDFAIYASSFAKVRICTAVERPAIIRIVT